MRKALSGHNVSNTVETNAKVGFHTARINNYPELF